MTEMGGVTAGGVTAGDAVAGLEWAEVAGRLHGERTIWLSTVKPDGAPHAAPVWLAVLAGDVYVFTSSGSVKARNLAGNPQAVLHAGDGEDVLIVSGRLERVGHPREFPEVLAAFADKYVLPGDDEFLPDQDEAADTLFQLVPTGAMTWGLEEFYGSQRRWSPT